MLAFAANLVLCRLALEIVEPSDRGKESSRLNDRERAALGYAEAMVRADDAKGILADLRCYFDDNAIIELTGLIAFQNMSSKFNNAFGVPPQGFCRVCMPARLTRMSGCKRDALN